MRSAGAGKRQFRRVISLVPDLAISGAQEITEAEIKAVAAQYHPQRFRLDAAAVTMKMKLLV